MDLTKKQIKAIIDKEMPGHRVVPEHKLHDTSNGNSLHAQVRSPGLSALRAKLARYIEVLRAADSTQEPLVAGPGLEVVHIEPRNSTARAGGPGPKAVLISPSRKTIIGTQG